MSGIFAHGTVDEPSEDLVQLGDDLDGTSDSLLRARFSTTSRSATGDAMMTRSMPFSATTRAASCTVPKHGIAHVRSGARALRMARAWKPTSGGPSRAPLEFCSELVREFAHAHYQHALLGPLDGSDPQER